MSDGEVQAPVDEMIPTTRLPLDVQEVLTATSVSAYVHSQVLNFSGEVPMGSQKLQKGLYQTISREIFTDRNKARSRSEKSAESSETQKLLAMETIDCRHGSLSSGLSRLQVENKKQLVLAPRNGIAGKGKVLLLNVTRHSCALQVPPS